MIITKFIFGSYEFKLTEETCLQSQHSVWAVPWNVD